MSVTSKGYLFIAIGILAMACSPIIIRYGQYAGAPSLLIAAGRMVTASLILTPFALRSHRAELSRLTRSDLLLAAVSGLFLALHFATWIASLEYTSVLISIVLIGTSSIWVGILETIFLRARLQGGIILAIVLTLIGGVMIGAGGANTTDMGSLTGALLSVAGAMAFSVYLVIGRKLRRELSLVPYIWVVYSFAAVLLALAVLVTRVPVIGYQPDAYLWIVVLALGPQLLGHTSMNYAVRYMSATLVSILSQLEPVGSSIAAYFLFHELPSWLDLIGSLIIFAGVVIASLAQNQRAAATDPIEETESAPL
jgi:drug/metabolite transporter (DMT)-like permease